MAKSRSCFPRMAPRTIACSFDLRFSKFEMRAFAATINDVVLDSVHDVLPAGISQQRWHRFVFGHGLTYRPTKKIELTLGETAVVQRQGFTVDLAYLNPLMIYQTTQHDTSQSGAGDANLTGFFAARATAGRATFSGELLVDDIQIDSKDRANYPNQLGWNLEAAYALPIIYVSSLGVQYRRINSFTVHRPGRLLEGVPELRSTTRLRARSRCGHGAWLRRVLGVGEAALRGRDREVAPRRLPPHGSSDDQSPRPRRRSLPGHDRRSPGSAARVDRRRCPRSGWMASSPSRRRSRWRGSRTSTTCPPPPRILAVFR